MQLNEKEIKRIFNKYKKAFEEMEHYDKTREILWGRERIYLTLDKKLLKKLKELKQKTGQPISRIIEKALKNVDVYHN